MYGDNLDLKSAYTVLANLNMHTSILVYYSSSKSAIVVLSYCSTTILERIDQTILLYVIFYINQYEYYSYQSAPYYP